MDQIDAFAHSLSQFSFNQYCSSGAFQYAFVATLVLGTLCFILTKVTTEYSWVDRIWSILPILYALHFLNHQTTCKLVPISTRQWVMLSLTSLWGLRLTYNFYRKGGYKSGGEDYRWAYIRKNYNWILVELLNFFFTAYYQLVLIMWFSSPIYNAQAGAFSLLDICLTLLWLILWIGQVVADQQQWNFQTKKYELLNKNGNDVKKLPHPYKIGFVTTGLFKYTRHPNFFCQISIWWVQFFFSCSSVGLNYTGIGAFLLNLLFLGSTGLTEKISTEKYPRYTQYQKTTSMLIPWIAGASLKEE